jgi:hypothetical protein
MQDSDGANSSQIPYQQPISTLGVAVPHTTAGSSIGQPGLHALGHSILTKDDSQERYKPD